MKMQLRSVELDTFVDPTRFYVDGNGDVFIKGMGGMCRADPRRFLLTVTELSKLEKPDENI